jgi:hypothetical protein
MKGSTKGSTQSAWLGGMLLLVALNIGVSYVLQLQAAPPPNTPPPNYNALVARVEALEAALGTVQANNVLALGPYVSVDTNTINGLVGPHIIFTGANLHVQSGSGATDGTVNGLGNLLVGYNEEIAPQTGDRGGSHNLITGMKHRYLSFGGFVAGIGNKISGANASVSGGHFNTASGSDASISGGSGSTASGSSASVSGGFDGTASGSNASVSGGSGSTASGAIASVSGGNQRSAVATFNWAAGGLFQAQ